MSFARQIFKSVQPIVTGIIAPGTNTGTITIISVNVNYSAVEWGGSVGGDLSGSFSGTGDIALSLINSTTVQWDRGYSNAGLDTNAEAYGSVLEFNPIFLRQPIATFINNSTFAHGLTLGPRAYIINGGLDSSTPTGTIGSNSLFAACRISGANVVFSALGGASVRGYIVDPW